MQLVFFLCIILTHTSKGHSSHTHSNTYRSMWERGTFSILWLFQTYENRRMLRSCSYQWRVCTVKSDLIVTNVITHSVYDILLLPWGWFDSTVMHSNTHCLSHTCSCFHDNFNNMDMCNSIQELFDLLVTLLKNRSLYLSFFYFIFTVELHKT